MSHGPEHHIEHAEHAVHASHDRFDKQVTMSIAIIAAVLACVTMLGHRAHNDTLRLQGEALKHQLQAGIKYSDAANRWAQYQALSIRNHYYETQLEELEFTPLRDGTTSLQDLARKRWQGQVNGYKTKMPEAKGYAEKFTSEGAEEMNEAEKRMEESHEVHQRADHFDMGELFLQLGVVICSLAILTKWRAFWYAGMASALLGAVLGLMAYLGMFLSHH